MRMPFAGMMSRDRSVWYANDDGTMSRAQSPDQVPEGAATSKYAQGLADRIGLQATIFEQPLGPAGVGAARIAYYDGRIMRAKDVDKVLDEHAESRYNRPHEPMSWAGVLVTPPGEDPVLFVARRDGAARRNTKTAISMAHEGENGMARGVPTLDQIDYADITTRFRFDSEYPPRHVAILRSYNGMDMVAVGAPEAHILKDRLARVMKEMGMRPASSPMESARMSKWDLLVCKSNMGTVYPTRNLEKAINASVQASPSPSFS